MSVSSCRPQPLSGRDPDRSSGLTRVYRNAIDSWRRVVAPGR